jgi:hypothetical protein
MTMKILSCVRMSVMSIMSVIVLISACNIEGIPPEPVPPADSATSESTPPESTAPQTATAPPPDWPRHDCPIQMPEAVTQTAGEDYAPNQWILYK